MSAEQLRRLANSYLEHVLLALRAGDTGANFRDFLDPWWVYERGGDFVHLRSDGGFSAHTFNNPCVWAHRTRLLKFDWMSAGAQKIFKMGEAARIRDRSRHPAGLRLIVDHAIPFAVLKQELWRERHSWDLDRLRRFLEENFKRAVLTHAADNQRLNAMRLHQSMPAGWKFGDDPFARYAAAGIQEAPA